MSIPISIGSGAASVAAEAVAGLQYQQIEVLGAGGSSVLSIDSTGAARVTIGSGSIIAITQGSVATTLVGGLASVMNIYPNVTSSGADGFAGYLEVFTPVGISAFPSGAQAGYVFNGTNFDRARGNSSIGTLVSTGSSSVISILQSPSIVGTYAEDAASASGDKGLLVMGARNDTLSSVTSADGDYSSHIVGPSGELIAANAPFTKWVSGTADFRNGNTGASIVVIAAQGASIFTYITGVQVANMGSASVLVTLAGTGSTLGYTIAPAGGGSNIYYQNALKTPANGTFAASISGVSSVLVSAQGFIAKI